MKSVDLNVIIWIRMPRNAARIAGEKENARGIDP